MRAFRPLLVLFGLTATPAALAECDAPYSTDQLLADMMAVEDGLRAADDGSAASAGKRLEAGLGCMDELLPHMMVGRTYRAIAAGLLVGSDEGAARQWFATAVEVDSTFDYGVEDLPPDHVVRDVYRDLKIAYVPEPETLEGQDLGPGTHYLDGKPINTPVAIQSRPHLYQLETDTVRSWVIKGNDFPPEALMATAVADSKKAKKEKVKRGQQVADSEYFQRARPPEKTPLLIGGVAAMVGAGAMYAYTAAVTRPAFDAATTREEAAQHRDMTNNLVLASGGVLAVGLAGFTWGVMVDDGTAIPTVRVRF